MGFDLRPRNRDCGDFEIGAFFWPWMLETGIGLPLGYGAGFMSGQFLARNRKDGKCIAYNDGARVSAIEAKQMAMVARWVAGYQESLRAEWEKMPADERERMTNDKSRLYKLPVRQDWVEKIRAFADWAEQSSGFQVH